jgi:hypothetical protein
LEAAMNHPELYRILLPDGTLSREIFSIAANQPEGILPGCVLVGSDRDGTQVTVHGSRLFQTALAQPPRACLKCGRVEGVVEDQVECPFGEAEPCEFVEPAVSIAIV